MRGFNEFTPMTRRIPDVPQKVLRRDSEVVKKIIAVQNDPDAVLNIFVKEQKSLSDYRYWELLRTVWIVAGRSDLLDVFIPLFKSQRKHRYYFSTPEEAERLRKMPQQFMAYRAINVGQNNISWTLKKEFAEWFKTHYKKDFIEEKLIDKSTVFAFIERRGEEEILIIE